MSKEIIKSKEIFKKTFKTFDKNIEETVSKIIIKENTNKAFYGDLIKSNISSKYYFINVYFFQVWFIIWIKLENASIII